ncbi:hypothetical protein N0V86_002719 [Didymella sp. IMI 355093]|nr:hypothetical protein N0V86_002719 [Didymella sp. IMI 355093]
MSTRNLLRHIFRHSARKRVNEDALPLGLKLHATEVAVNTTRDRTVFQNKQPATSNSLPPPFKTLEPFRLENIAEEDAVDSPSAAETESSTETLTSFELEISTFSTRELLHATLYEAKSAAASHLDTINTTLSLLEALDGFSATISELRKEMLEKKQACEEQLATMDAVERAIEGMTLAGELQEDEVGDEDEK